MGIPSTYVQATPDLMMGDLLKNMRSSQIFSVCGLPEVKLHRLKPKSPDDPMMYQAELLGFDVFDPTTMETDHRSGGDVPTRPQMSVHRSIYRYYYQAPSHEAIGPVDSPASARKHAGHRPG